MENNKDHLSYPPDGVTELPTAPPEDVQKHLEKRRRELQKTLDGPTKAPQPEYTKHWPEFLEVMESRLLQGHRDYGDGSFSRDVSALLAEVEEELLDLVGWPFIAWVRVRRLRAALEEVAKSM